MQCSEGVELAQPLEWYPKRTLSNMRVHMTSVALSLALWEYRGLGREDVFTNYLHQLVYVHYGQVYHERLLPSHYYRLILDGTYSPWGYITFAFANVSGR